jgi:replicative DNA helicase
MNQDQTPSKQPESAFKKQDGKPSPMFNIRNVVGQVSNHYQIAIAGKNCDSCLPTGIRQLDQMLGGLMPGLHMLAGRPATGKTTLMLSIAGHLAVERKVPFLIFTGNSSAYQLVRRMTFARAGLSPFLPHHNAIAPSPPELLRLKHSASEHAESPLYIEDSFDFSIESLRSIATRYQRDASIRFIAIDNLDALRSNAMAMNPSREREIAEIAIQLRNMSRELDIPVLLLADLSRKPEHRGGKRPGLPRMTDIRYSDMITGYADTIALLFRAQFYAETSEEHEALLGQAELIVCRSLIGVTGVVELCFDQTLARFEEIESGN